MLCQPCAGRAPLSSSGAAGAAPTQSPQQGAGPEQTTSWTGGQRGPQDVPQPPGQGLCWGPGVRPRAGAPGIRAPDSWGKGSRSSLGDGGAQLQEGQLLWPLEPAEPTSHLGRGPLGLLASCWESPGWVQPGLTPPGWGWRSGEARPHLHPRGHPSGPQAPVWPEGRHCTGSLVESKAVLPGAQGLGAVTTSRGPFTKHPLCPLGTPGGLCTPREQL